MEHEAGGGHADFHLGHGEIGHEVSHDLGHGHDAHHESDNGFMKALSLLGIGRVPLFILFSIMMISFGVIGLGSNLLWKEAHFPPNFFFWISFGIAVVGCLLVTNRLASFIGKHMPTMETVSIRNEDLVGRTGESIYGVYEDRGFVQVRDTHGNVHRVAARTAQGSIASGKEVILEEYRPDGDYFIVSESNLA
jgi:membrane protein implicated in regulation of membrane protease activity